MYPPVKYELKQLERLLTYGRHKNRSRNLNNRVIHETKRIKHSLICSAFSRGDEKYLERFIKFHQEALIRLMDKVSHRINSQNKTAGCSDFYLLFASCVEELLTFIKHHFANYFDPDTKAPDGYIAKAKNDAQKSLCWLRQQFKERKVDSHLADLTLKAFRKLGSGHASQPITIRRIIYLQELHSALAQVLEQPENKCDLNEEVRRIILYLNYNTHSSFVYFTQFIRASVQNAGTQLEKIIHLSFILKKLNQVPVKPGIQYNQKAPSLKSQLNQYLAEEIEYLEKLHLLAQSNAINAAPGVPGVVLKSKTSVAQLAFFMKLLIETKVLMNDSVSQVLNVASRMVLTKRSAPVSFGSLRSKYYDVEKRTQDSVRALLQNMIRHIDQQQ